MKQLKITTILLLSIMIVIIGCGDDGDSPAAPDENNAPVMEGVTAENDTVFSGDRTTLTCTASDEDGDDLTYLWTVPAGTFPNQNDSESVIWQAPDSTGEFNISITVSDGSASVSGEVILHVIPIPVNSAPEILSVVANPDTVLTDGTVTLTCTASDPEGDPLTFSWTAVVGDFPVQNTGETVTWRAPGVSGEYTISVDVSDGIETVNESVGVFVRESETPAPEGMVLIPSGNVSFQMGSENGFADELPIHQVSFTSDFWMDITEVTQADYDEVMGNAFPEYFTPSWRETYGVGDNYPAYELEWGDAALYCNARSKRDGLDTVYTYSSIDGTPGGLCQLVDVVTDFSANGYRMPTEAEWEFACRGNVGTDFYWNRDFDPYPATEADSIEIGEYTVWSGNSWSYGIDDTEHYGNHPVASKSPNGFGLYDMCGNISEWINDWYEEYSAESITDPRGGENTWHMARGGSWGNDPIYLRSANRTFDAPGYFYAYVGFRTVRMVP